MKVLLLKDVYKLGRAGDVKRVADGYGRNFLLPQNLAVLATAGAMKQAESIRKQATIRRAALNEEMSSVAEVLSTLTLTFSSKAGETGKLYGSITNQMIADAIKEKSGVEVESHQIDIQPIRTLGEKKAQIRLTVDLMPEVKIIVHREGEVVPNLLVEEEAKAEAAPVVEPATVIEVEAVVEVAEVAEVAEEAIEPVEESGEEEDKE